MTMTSSEQCGRRIGAQAMFCAGCDADQKGGSAIASENAPPSLDQPPPQPPLTTPRPHSSASNDVQRSILGRFLSATEASDAVRMIAGGHVVIGAGQLAWLFQVITNGTPTGRLLYYLLLPASYALASLGWWSWSRAIAGNPAPNPRLHNAFKLLALSAGAVTVGLLAYFFQSLSDHGSAGYQIGALIQAIGATVLALGFWSWGTIAGSA